MNGLDWFLIALGVLCLARGVFRGAISQVFGIAGVIGGVLVAAHSYEAVARQLSVVFPGLPGASAITFIVLFLLTWFCVGVAGSWTGKLLRHGGLGFLDRLLGGMIGLAKACILAAIVVALLTFLLSPKNSLLAQSSLAPHVEHFVQMMLEATPKNLQELFEEKQKALKRQWLEQEEKNTRGEGSKAKAAKI